MKALLVLLSLLVLISSARSLQDDARNAGGDQNVGSRQENGETPPIVDETVVDAGSDKPKDNRSPHDKRMDQEALVGGASAWDSLKDLSAEEAEKQIRRLSGAMDKDRDGIVSQAELIRWLRIAGERAGKEENYNTFSKLDKDGNGRLSLAEYLDGSRARGPEDKELEEMKFSDADQDSDGYLSEDELRIIVMPTYHTHILEHLVTERLDRYDTNTDGFIDMDEFVGIPDGGNEASPKWIDRKKSEFKQFVDTNGDGRLDREEVKHWLMSEEREFLVQEAAHLIKSADTNQDGQLSVDEIFVELDVFLDGIPHTRFQKSTHEEL